MTDADLFWESKRRKLQEANLEKKMKPLVEVMGELREISGGRTVPKFDPDDGGVDAEVLLLFQDPGPKVIKTGFISRDNPDQSAKLVRETEKEIGLDRGRTVRWNAVPWQIVNEDKRERKRELKSELERVKEEECLTHLLKKFEGRNLKAVALFGKDHVWAFADEVKRATLNVRVCRTYHPAPQPMHRFPEYRKHFKETYQEIKDFLDR